MNHESRFRIACRIATRSRILPTCRHAGCALGLLSVLLIGGCSPTTSAIKLGAKLVGKAVGHDQAEQWRKELVGHSLSVADAKFGRRVDVYRDVHSANRWVVYDDAKDPLHLHRIIVAERGGIVGAVTKASKFGSPKTSIPEAALYSSKAKGKSPAECETALGLGPPLITARNERTGRLRQVYKAGLIEIKGITSPHYCLVAFGADGRCERVDVVSEKVSSRSE
jgi:hypothetical protein